MFSLSRKVEKDRGECEKNKLKMICMTYTSLSTWLGIVVVGGPLLMSLTIDSLSRTSWCSCFCLYLLHIILLLVFYLVIFIYLYVFFISNFMIKGQVCVVRCKLTDSVSLPPLHCKDLSFWASISIQRTL